MKLMTVEPYLQSALNVLTVCKFNCGPFSKVSDNQIGYPFFGINEADTDFRHTKAVMS